MKSKEQRKRNLLLYSMFFPFAIFFLLFIFLPILTSIIISFTDFNMLQFPNFIGFKNYIRVFTEDDVFMIAFKNTLVIALVTGPISYILSFCLAWMICELPDKIRPIITFIIYSPALAGNVYFIWTYIFASDRRGFLNDLIIKFGIINEPISWLTDSRYALGIVIIVSIWSGFGVGFLSFISGLKSMNRSYYEAAAIDGIHNRWQELYYVTLPQIGPQLLFSAVLTISGSFAAGNVSQALTGFPSTDYMTHTIILHITDYGTVRYEMGYASALAVILFALMIITWRLINKVLSRFNP